MAVLFTTPDKYDRHIVSRHAGKPADIKLYGLKFNIGDGRMKLSTITSIIPFQ
jgi:hypothetical protein